MRIAILDDRFDEVYGAQENVLLLGALCRDAGHSVTFLTTAEGRLATEARERGLETRVVLAPPSLRQFEREALSGGLRQQVGTAFDLLRYGWTLHRTLRDLRVELVVASAVRPALLLVPTGVRRRPRVLLFAQNSIPMGPFALVAALVAWRIGLIGPGARSTFPRPVRSLVARRFRPLPSGRDFTAFDELGPPAARPSGERLEIVTLCSITRRKGLDLLIDAMADAALPPAHLTVVGGTNGPKGEAYLAELVEQADRRGLEVTFAGWQDDVLPYLRRADLVALASYDEGLPGVLLEAMAAGVACVTTRAGSAGDLVEECGAGLAVDVGDRAGLTAALEALGNDRERRLAYAERGHREVRRRYGLDAFLAAFLTIASDDPEAARPRA